MTTQEGEGERGGERGRKMQMVAAKQREGGKGKE